jgi:hypothetical protein
MRVKIIGCIAVLLTMTFFLTAYSPGASKVIISGRVLDDGTGEPIVNVLVYTRAGEIEAVTDKKGFFKIETWQELPVELQAFHPKFNAYKVQLKQAGQELKIKLSAK